MRVPAAATKSRTALFVSAMLLVASLANAQTDSMAKWKPAVGDRFVFSERSIGTNHGVTQYDMTATDTTFIVQTDYKFDSAHNGVVVAKCSVGATDYYWFRPDTSSSSHPFIIATNRWRGYSGPSSGTFPTVYNFSKSKESLVQFDSTTLSVLYTVASVGSVMEVQYSSTAMYSPELRWFTNIYNSTFTTPCQCEYSCEATLLSALHSTNSVALQGDIDRKINPIAANFRAPFLSIDLVLPSTFHGQVNLLDPLGRPIRSWAMEVAAGESQVHLNVADVPSGVYFLRVSAPGLGDVKKVCIVH